MSEFVLFIFVLNIVRFCFEHDIGQCAAFDVILKIRQCAAFVVEQVNTTSCEPFWMLCIFSLAARAVFFLAARACCHLDRVEGNRCCDCHCTDGFREVDSML